MKRSLLILLCLSILLVVPNLALADCIPVAFFNNFAVESPHTVILYAWTVPVVKLDVNVAVTATSTIRLLKDSVCDGDDILIDGSRYTILTAELPK